jgi:branched-chain amino acid aminotransferase
MEKIRGNSIILNGKVREVADYKPGPTVPIYYEVIRVIESKFLFLQDHLERLQHSCSKAGVICPSKTILKNELESLIKTEQISEGNIKLTVFNGIKGVERSCFFVPHFYPSELDYTLGVVTKTFPFERPEPTIKRWNETFRKNVNRFIREEHIYEAILVNEDACLSEGSRSNLFFIDSKNNIFTAPENIILPGITRKYVLEICKENNLRIFEKVIKLDEAREMQACFISGTSPMVLPVRQMDQIKYDVELKVLKDLISSYQSIIKKHFND